MISPVYYLCRKFNRQPPLPMNYTFSLTNRCNSRCETCRIYEKSPEGELTSREWGEVFRGLGGHPLWATLSGGEPFLRKDISEIHHALCAICGPKVVNIPTNGLLPRVIASQVHGMLNNSPRTRLVINVSIDHHDPQRNAEIRGAPKAYEKAVETLEALLDLKKNHQNLTAGIHTVISKLNVQDFGSILRNLTALKPDQYITEIAEERVELGTMGLPITPDQASYHGALRHLITSMDTPWSGLSRLTKMFRRQYYGLVERTLVEKRQVIPCFAGYASVQINPEGNVWFCCIKAQSLGNVKFYDYDLRRLWNSPIAHELRQGIRRGECYCPMANASYTNMLHHPPTILKALKEVMYG